MVKITSLERVHIHLNPFLISANFVASMSVQRNIHVMWRLVTCSAIVITFLP